jgi:prolyl-tRNA editing enzyme YbaK/EbsC (Cys-tRNA(Pro) deacylase)
MSLERAREYLKSKGFESNIIIPEHSSATVAEAAQALGCEPGMIAKTLSFLQSGPEGMDKAVLILAEGMARIDNRKYKDRFGCKAKMIPADLVEEMTGHGIGGVCPFGVKEGVVIYLDQSLKKHETVYPAAGTDHSAVKLTIAELEECCGRPEWVDVCK